MGIYLYQKLRKDTTQEERKMTKAERKAIESRVKDLIKQGIDKELAKVMAKTELQCGLIRPVVNY